MKPRAMFLKTIDENGKDVWQTLTKHSNELKTAIYEHLTRRPAGHAARASTLPFVCAARFRSFRSSRISGSPAPIKTTSTSPPNAFSLTSWGNSKTKTNWKRSKGGGRLPEPLQRRPWRTGFPREICVVDIVWMTSTKITRRDIVLDFRRVFAPKFNYFLIFFTMFKRIFKNRRHCATAQSRCTSATISLRSSTSGQSATCPLNTKRKTSRSRSTTCHPSKVQERAQFVRLRSRGDRHHYFQRRPTRDWVIKATSRELPSRSSDESITLDGVEGKDFKHKNGNGTLPSSIVVTATRADHRWPKTPTTPSNSARTDLPRIARIEGGGITRQWSGLGRL